MNRASAVTYARYRRALDGHHLPAAWLDLAAFHDNIDRTLTRAGTATIRVASKSVRCVEALRRVLEASTRMQGLLCFTPSEAAHLHRVGFDDLVVAYPNVDRADLLDAIAEVAVGATITLMVDDVAQVEAIGALAVEHGVTMRLCIDLDVSYDLPGLRFGVYRSPVRDADTAAALAEAIVATDGVIVDGLMAYEAQIAGVGDQGLHPRLQAVKALKRRSIPDVANRRAAAVEAVQSVAGDLRFVNGGGTGSIESTIAEDAVTEVAVGSAFLAPGLFDHYSNFELRAAAGFVLPIVRRPTDTIVTCLGGGYIASGAVGDDKAPVVHLPDGGTLLANEGAGEVQTPVEFGSAAAAMAIGDPVFFRHAKAGELCERFTELLVIDGDEVTERWTTYRGAGWCFV